MLTRRLRTMRPERKLIGGFRMHPLKFMEFAKVQGGHIVPNNRRLFSQLLSQFEGKDIIIEIKPKRKQRSLPQNNYIHLLFTLLTRSLNELGNAFTMDIVKDMCKLKFAPKIDIVDKSTGEVIGRRDMGTSEMTPTELNEFMEQVIVWAADMFHIVLPYPNEVIGIRD